MKKPLVYIYVFCGFLFCSPFFSCGKDYVLEKEPNNTFANANPAHLKGSIRGFIDTAIDRYIYFLRVDRAGCIDLHLSGIKGVNLAVKVWRAGADGGAPVLIKVIDDSRK